MESFQRLTLWRAAASVIILAIYAALIAAGISPFRALIIDAIIFLVAFVAAASISVSLAKAVSRSLGFATIVAVTVFVMFGESDVIAKFAVVAVCIVATTVFTNVRVR